MAANFSLRNRILWSAAIVLLVFLSLTGLVLDQAFQRTAEQGIAEKLRIQIYGLLSVTELDQGQILLPEALQEPRFNNPGSGLLALVRDGQGTEVWRSESGITLDLSPQQSERQYQALRPGQDRFAKLESEQLFYLAYKILWLDADERSYEYTFIVMESVDGYETQLTSFRNNLWGWLGLVGVALILVQALVMNWGLRSLSELAKDLEAIESGEQNSLTASYPKELTGVTKNLNVLIASERSQREKYRTTMADLAHSIKTPLAILKNAANDMPADLQRGEGVKSLIDEQVSRMDEIVGYQLERARTSRSSVIKRSIDVEPVMKKLQLALQKVYPDTAFSTAVETSTFFGDERDFMEILGNLIDNACKYGRSTVALSSKSLEGGTLIVVVEDDGPGIPKTKRKGVLERGARMDSRAPGQGIGLAVVLEIVDRYGGDITIDESTLGGARISIRFS